MGDRDNDTVDENIDEQEENVDEQEQDDTGSDDNKNEDEEEDDDEDEEENTDADEDDSEGDDDEDEEKDKKSKKDADEEDDDEEPQTRKGKTDWRKAYFAEKHQPKGKENKGDDEDDEEDDDDIAPEDEAMVDKVIRKRYGSKFDQLDEKADKSEVNEFVAKNPQFKPYEQKILKFLRHPSRAHLPVKTVAYEVAGDDLMKIGAKKGKQADIQAKKKAGGGHSTSKASGGTKSVADMTDAEMSAEVERVKHSRRD